MPALSSLGTHIQKMDGWIHLGFEFLPDQWNKQTKRKEVQNINKRLIKMKESKLDRVWLTWGKIRWISRYALIWLKTQYSNSG